MARSVKQATGCRPLARKDKSPGPESGSGQVASYRWPMAGSRGRLGFGLVSFWACFRVYLLFSGSFALLAGLGGLRPSWVRRPSGFDLFRQQRGGGMTWRSGLGGAGRQAPSEGSGSEASGKQPER